MIVKKKKGWNRRWWWWRPLVCVIAILIIPVAAFLINAPFFLFFHVMPATICNVVIPPDNTKLMDLCFILGQYHWVAEVAAIGLLVLPCFAIFYTIDSCAYKARRKKNKKHTANCGRVSMVIALTLILSLVITAPYQIIMLRVCRPGGYGMRFVSTPPGVVEHASRYYILHGPEHGSLTYLQSMQSCRTASASLGFEPPFGTSAYLAAIETQQEQEFITQYLNKHHNTTGQVRIGGMKEPPTWKHHWNRGTLGKQDFNYANWAPDAGKEGWGNCVSMKRKLNVTKFGGADYLWVPESCVWGRDIPYLCEMPAQLNYMLCTWMSGSVYMAIILEIFTIVFISYRVIQRRNIKMIEFPHDVPALVITSPDSESDL